MTTPTLLDFLTYEVDDYVREELLSAIAELSTGQRYFTYNAYNVLLDAGSLTATVEDELDVNRQDTVPIATLTELLRGGALA
jgi:hypothetical protein